MSQSQLHSTTSAELAGRRRWPLIVSALFTLSFLLVIYYVVADVVFGVKYFYLLVSVGAAGMQMSSFMGGFHWQAFAYALWESFLAVGVCLGLLVLFRQRWNRQGRLARGLAASAYTVYLIHPLLVVGFASAFSTVALYPLLKFVIAVLLVLPLSFLVGLVLRKLPLANRML